MKNLRELSGFGWDAEKSLVTAPDDVWEKYLEVRASLICSLFGILTASPTGPP